MPNNPLWVFSLLRITAVIILHPSNRHFGILQAVLKFILGHHGIILAAVPKGDIRGIASTSFLCCLIADLFPKRKNARNRIPLYVFGAISGVCFRYERLCFDGGILTVRHSKAAVCHFRVTKKRRIATTLLSCSEDGAREHYSIICCTFSFCLQPLCRWLRRR